MPEDTGSRWWRRWWRRRPRPLRLAALGTHARYKLFQGYFKSAAEPPLLPGRDPHGRGSKNRRSCIEGYPNARPRGPRAQVLPSRHTYLWSQAARFKSPLCHLLAVQPGASDLTSLYFCSLIWKTGIIIYIVEWSGELRVDAYKAIRNSIWRRACWDPLRTVVFLPKAGHSSRTMKAHQTNPN